MGPFGDAEQSQSMYRTYMIADKVYPQPLQELTEHLRNMNVSAREANGKHGHGMMGKLA